ncbi:hypothetical protein [Nocardia nova]|uniref:hypothetical protein n=1 Tax=Nocardia nova TaxID=37330 RepID=UPI001CA4EB5B|nr:hypothetical protein [Nocardia nova]
MRHLRSAGHQVVVGDLCAMGWKSQADAADFGETGAGTFMHRIGRPGGPWPSAHPLLAATGIVRVPPVL